MRSTIFQTIVCILLALQISYAQTEVKFTSGSFPLKKELKSQKVPMNDELVNEKMVQIWLSLVFDLHQLLNKIYYLSQNQ